MATINTLASVALALGLVGGCTCTNPENIDVGPNCPGGKPASATMSVHGELEGIRPLGSDKQIRVRGIRASDATLCFADGGELEFRIVLEGQSTVDVVTPALAHGAWEITAVALSGGDHPEIPPLNKVLQPGTAFTTSVTSNAVGDLQLQVTP